MIYVWHKENGILIEKLKGHASCVNAIAWNPCDPGMFASAGDDRRVRMYVSEPRVSEAQQADFMMQMVKLSPTK